MHTARQTRRTNNKIPDEIGTSLMYTDRDNRKSVKSERVLEKRKMGRLGII